jgi:hypothetical protein
LFRSCLALIVSLHLHLHLLLWSLPRLASPRHSHRSVSSPALPHPPQLSRPVVVFLIRSPDPPLPSVLSTESEQRAESAQEEEEQSQARGSAPEVLSQRKERGRRGEAARSGRGGEERRGRYLAGNKLQNHPALSCSSSLLASRAQAVALICLPQSASLSLSQ